MRLLAITAGSWILAATCAAQESTVPASAHWPTFRNSHDGEWRVRWNKATQTPKAIFGTGLRLEPGAAETLEDARRRAGRVLDTFPELLGLVESQFVESVGQQLLQTWIFVYQQRYDGLEVLGGRADVRVHRNGAVSMFGSKAVTIPAGFTTTPRIDPDFATLIARRRVGVANAETKIRLIVHADVHAPTPTEPRLAWEVIVSSRTPFVRERVFVDAGNGSVIESWNEVYTCAFGHTHVRGDDGAPRASATERRTLARAIRAPKRAGNLVTGTVLGFMNTSSDGTSAATNQPIPDVLVSIDGGGSAFTDANGNFAISDPGTAPVTVRVNLDQLRTRHARGGINTFEGVGDPFCNPSTAGCVNNPPVVTAAMVADVVQATPGGAPVTLQLAQGQTEFEVSQVTSYWHINDVNQWVRSIHGDTTQLNLLSNVAVFDNWGASCNAFYSNNQTHFFSSGGGCTNSGFQ
ncbi:MAG: hypothetical protein KDB80_18265, partial [Planctomycetes bacterium]|nr:hypothetical protein [Planctomycetota bacterium]